MQNHVLTTERWTPLDAASQLARLRGGRLEDVPGLLGAWQTQFGPLNQFLYLQAVDDPLSISGVVPPDAEGALPLRRDREILRPLLPFRPHTDDIGVYEFRQYELRPGMGERFAESFIEVMAVRTRYSPNFGVWKPLSGQGDRIFHMWAYPGFAERDAARAALRTDPGWAAFGKDAAPMLLTQTSMVLSAVHC